MGTLFYGSALHPIAIPDALLAHLQAVVFVKLRRRESFLVSWRHPQDAPSGETTVWIQPAVPLRFEFDAAEPARLDRATLQRFADAANSTAGLRIDLDADVSTGAEPLLQNA